MLGGARWRFRLFVALVLSCVGVVVGKPRALHHDIIVVGRRLPHIAEIPDALVVVAVSRFDHVGLEVELHPHLAHVVAEQSAERAADGLLLPVILLFEELAAAFDHPRVVVFEVFVDQRTGQARHQRPGGYGTAGLGDMEGFPQTPQPGKFAHDQLLDARVFYQRNQSHLQRLEASHRKALRGEHDVSGGMGGSGAIQREPRLPAETAVGLRHPDRPSVDRGAPSCARAFGMDDRPQLDVASPQGTQVKRQAAFDVGEYRLIAFHLQQLAAFFAVEREVTGLRVRIAHVRLHAEHGPTLQAIEGQVFEKPVEALQDRRNADGCEA